MTENGVIASGRGGDLCKFVESEEDLTVQERDIGAPAVSSGFLNMFGNINFLLQRLHGIHAEEEEEEEEEVIDNEPFFLGDNVEEEEIFDLDVLAE